MWNGGGDGISLFFSMLTTHGIYIYIYLYMSASAPESRVPTPELPSSQPTKQRVMPPKMPKFVMAVTLPTSGVLAVVMYTCHLRLSPDRISPSTIGSSQEGLCDSTAAAEARSGHEKRKILGCLDLRPQRVCPAWNNKKIKKKRWLCDGGARIPGRSGNTIHVRIRKA